MPELNVFQKIIEVKKEITCFNKDCETTGARAYKYISGTQVLSKIKSKMEEIGLLFMPVEVENRGWQTFDYLNAKGEQKTDFIVEGKLVYAWINAEKPEDQVRIPFEYYGQQNDISKAFGSGLTYSERYLLLKALGVPTDEEDPDGRNEDKKARAQNKPKNEQKQTKWASVNELIKDTNITLANVNDWILRRYGKAIKINNLSEEQFDEMMTRLQAKIAGEVNE
ncbi:MAG: ERF family protein [Clostridia bacterium]|nr:ERF family protein [Clostridia bacterium]